MRKAQDQDSGMAKVPPSRGKPQDVEWDLTLVPTLDTLLLDFRFCSLEAETKLAAKESPSSYPRANSPLLSIFIVLHKPLYLWLTSPALGRSKENLSNHSHWSYDSTPIPRALKSSTDWSDELLTSFCCDWGLARQHKVYPISYTSTSSSTTWSMTSTLTTAAQSGWKCGLSYTSHKPPLYNAAAPARGVSV